MNDSRSRWGSRKYWCVGAAVLAVAVGAGWLLFDSLIRLMVLD